MKKNISLLAVFLLLAFQAPLSSYNIDYSFQKERMIVDHREIFAISSWDHQDGVAAWDINGRKIWDIKFDSKIISWDLQPHIILIFSKDRNGNTTYLNCIDRFTGHRIW